MVQEGCIDQESILLASGEMFTSQHNVAASLSAQCMNLAKFRERLDSLTPGADFSSLTPSEVSLTLETSRDWNDRNVNEHFENYSAILTWPRRRFGGGTLHVNMLRAWQRQ